MRARQRTETFAVIHKARGDYRCHSEGVDDVSDRPMAASGNSDANPSTDVQGIDGSGDPARTVSPEQAEQEAELEQLAEHTRQVAPRLLGLTVQEAAAAVARTPALRIRFIEEGDAHTEEYCWGRITALTHNNVVTEPFAG